MEANSPDPRLQHGKAAADHPRQVFENIFWPAAAGNVFWSFCSLLIKPEPSEIGNGPRLVLLGILSLYLTVGWLRLRDESGVIAKRYWIWEFLHLVILVFCGLAAQVGPSILVPSLAVYFVVMAIGHFFKAWKLSDEKYPRGSLVVAHLIGLGILLFGSYGASLPGLPEIGPQSTAGMKQWWEEWTIPGSFLVVLVLWFILRRHQVGKFLPWK